MNQQHKKHEHDKKSHNIHSHNQPHETRDALDKDIKAIGQKFGAEHVKEEAKDSVVETLTEAKDTAVEKLVEAKDTAVDTLVEAKDSAVEKLVEAKDKLVETKDVAVEKLAETKDVVAEKLTEAKDAAVEKLHDYKEVAVHALATAGEQARRAGDASWSFARQNALPLTLIGIGASWLIASGRRSSSRSADSQDTHSPRPKLSAPARGSASSGHSTGKSHRPSMRPRHEEGAESEHSTPDSAAHSATQQVSELAARAGQKAMDVYGRAEHAVLGGAVQGREFAVQQFTRARDGSREFIQENPLAVGAMALATGIGIGLLIPSTEPENALYGAARDRLVGEAREAAASVREAAQSVASVAKETASSLV